MPFEHAVTTEWGRWLRTIFAARSPNVQVVGQSIEDSLRAVILAHDLRNLSTPIRWAQAATRRQTPGVAGQLSRVELHCLSPGGLWVDEVNGPDGVYNVQVADAPLTVPNRFFITEFGNIPTVSALGTTNVAEAVPGITEPLRQGGGFDTRGFQPPQFLPFGKVMVFRSTVLNTILNLQWIGWREIPAPR